MRERRDDGGRLLILLRTGTDREGLQRVGYNPFARPSGNGRTLRTPAIPVGSKRSILTTSTSKSGCFLAPAHFPPTGTLETAAPAVHHRRALRGPPDRLGQTRGTGLGEPKPLGGLLWRLSLRLQRPCGRVAIGGLYLLAAPSTPAEVIEAVVERNKLGFSPPAAATTA